jgi:replication factor C subunit 1
VPKYVKEEDLEDMDNDDDIYSANFKGKGDDYLPEDGDEDMDDFLDDDEEEDVKPKKKTAAKKRKSDEMDDVTTPAKPSRARKTNAASKPSSAKKAKKDAVPAEDGAVEKILNDIPLVRAPTPPPRQVDKNGQPKRFNFGQFKGNQAAAPAVSSKDLPTGEENCLAGLKFVFTGQLEALDRDSGKELVKRHGGQVQSAATSKTDYVVLGSDAGPKKLETIKQHNLKTINEDGLFQLIRTLPAHGGSGVAASAAKDKAAKEEEAAKRKALEMEAREKAEAKEREMLQKKLSKVNGPAGPRIATIPESSKLWTVKYSPQSVDQVVGNKTNVEKLARWLRNFRKNAKTNFKLGGPDGTGTYRAVIIHGPPGVGKTTAAHLVAKLEGYDIVESNASDTRSKKLVEEGLRGVLSTTSLMGYFRGNGKPVKPDNSKGLVLIMDEVDGMSAGDRGGVGALAAMCKKTNIPIILICNDRRQPKMKPFDFVAFDMQFRRPTTDQIKSRLMTIAFREKMKIPPPVLTALIEGTGADIRQTINMLSTVKMDEGNLTFDKSKEMSKAWEKHVVLKPWDIVGKILNSGMFAANSKATLNQKVELYFNDHEFSHLMLQENYLNSAPLLANGLNGKAYNLKHLELAESAASSISDGDLVDRMIHGTQQQWSLMPTHAMFSFVRPASFMSGSMGYNQSRFTTWLGNNSKQTKLTRMVREIQGHMRLRSTADRHEVRQQYMPVFWTKMPKRLQVEGKEAVPAVIDLMDSYFLTKDDFDAIIELGLASMDEKHLKITPADKSAFTRS